MIFERTVRPVDFRQLAATTTARAFRPTSSTLLPSRVIYRPYTLAGSFLETVGDFVNDAIDTANKIDDTANQIENAARGGGTLVDVVPYQNAVFNGVVVPISNVVNGPNASRLTQQEIQYLLNALDSAYQKWETFIHSYPWPTAQARNRALAGEATLAPYWDLYRQRLNALLPNADYSYTEAAFGVNIPVTTAPPTYPGQGPRPGDPGYVGPVQPTGGGTSTAGFSQIVPVALGLAALYFLTRKRGS